MTRRAAGVIFGIGTSELLILVVIGGFLIGPERFPEYLAKLRTLVRQARDLAQGAKSQLKEQMGPDFEDVDWRQYDPRQYDPRKIIKDALFDEEPDDPDAAEALEDPAVSIPDPVRFDPDHVTRYDVYATRLTPGELPCLPTMQ